MSTSDIKQFVTAAKGRTRKDQKNTITFEHDGRTITATQPKDGQLAMLMAGVSGYSQETEQAKATIDFFIGLFEDREDKHYFRDRLLDGEDDFDLEDLEDILYYLIEEFSARPTKPSSASTSPPLTSGDGSTGTAEPEGSTSSPSPFETLAT